MANQEPSVWPAMKTVDGSTPSNLEEEECCMPEVDGTIDNLKMKGTLTGYAKQYALHH